MGWSVGFDTRWNRDIGYGVPAYCDYPGCKAEINRGLGYVCCGSEPYGGEYGCGLFFCGEHSGANGQCERCAADADPFEPTPDHPDWMRHKLTDDSWRRWRTENQTEISKLRDALRNEMRED